ncbi:MAG: ABC transporter permease [Symbiobacteriaceae bacterium]|nr:ABC transporter permease [Symbiobacteriaceae bacterium]
MSKDYISDNVGSDASQGVELPARGDIAELFSLAEFSETQAEMTGYSDYSYWGSTITMFFRKKLAVAILLLLVSLLAFTFIQPYLPNQLDPTRIYFSSTGGFIRNNTPNSTHWFGTNAVGQDLWARIWSGTRTSMMIALIVASWDLIVGIIFGALWGYVRQVEAAFEAIYNVLNNVPSTVIHILLSYIMRPSMSTMIFAFCITGWVPTARYVRNQIMIIRDREYNLASRCLGTPTSRLITRNMLPHLVSVLTLRFAMSIPATITSELTLTYVGLGLPISIPSLGNLVGEGRAVMMDTRLRYQLFFPCAVVCLIAISFYLIGNAFSDAADPRNHV